MSSGGVSYHRNIPTPEVQPGSQRLERLPKHVLLVVLLEHPDQNGIKKRPKVGVIGGVVIANMWRAIGETNRVNVEQRQRKSDRCTESVRRDARPTG